MPADEPMIGPEIRVSFQNQYTVAWHRAARESAQGQAPGRL